MNIPFDCDICGKSLAIASSWAGRSIRCECGNLIIVPNPTSEGELPLQCQSTKLDQMPSNTEVEKGHYRCTRRFNFKGLVIGGLTFLVIALVGALSLFTGVSDNELTKSLGKKRTITTDEKENTQEQIPNSYDDDKSLPTTRPNVKESMTSDGDSISSNRVSKAPSFEFPLDNGTPTRPKQSEFTGKQSPSVPARIAMLHERKFVLRDWAVQNTTPFKGRLKIKKGGLVTIELPTGQLKTVAISELSHQDKQYLYLTYNNRESEADSGELLVSLPTVKLIVTSDNPSQTGNLVSASELPPQEEILYSVTSELNRLSGARSTKKAPIKPLPITAVYRSYANSINTNSRQSLLKDTYVETRIQQQDSNYLYRHALIHKSRPISIQSLNSLIVNLSNKSEAVSVTHAEYSSRAQDALADFRKALPATTPSEVNHASALRTIATKWQSQTNAKEREFKRLRSSVALYQELVTFLNDIDSWDLKITIYHRTSKDAPLTPVARSGIQTDHTIPDFPLNSLLNETFDTDSPNFPKGIETKLQHQTPILALGQTEDQELLSLSAKGEIYRDDRKLPFLLPALSNQRFPAKFNAPSGRIFYASESDSEDGVQLQLFAHHINNETESIDKAINDFFTQFNKGYSTRLAISPNGTKIVGCRISTDEMTSKFQILNCEAETTAVSIEQTTAFIPDKVAVNDNGEFALGFTDGTIQLCRLTQDGAIQKTGDFGHPQSIRLMHFVDEQTFLSVDESGTTILYDMKTADVKAILKIGEPVFCASVSPNKQWLFLGTLSGAVRVFTNTDYAEHFQLFGHFGSVTHAISFIDASNKLIFVSGGEDGSIKIWDFTNAKAINTKTSNTTYHDIAWDRESVLGQLRNKVIKRDFNNLTDSFITAESVAASQDLRIQLSRLKSIFELSREFSTRATQFWSGIGPNSTLKFSDREINVVEINKDFVTLRDQGVTLEPRSLHAMTVGVASIVFEAQIIDDPDLALQFAAYLVTCDDLTEVARRRAIKLWKENCEPSQRYRYPRDLIERFLTDRY